MKNLPPLSAPACLLAATLLITACGDKAPNELSQPEAPAATDAVTSNASAIDSESLKKLADNSCDLLTRGDIQSVAGTSESDIQQFNLLGCQYSWGDADTGNSVSVYVDAFFHSDDSSQLDFHFRSLANMLTGEEKARKEAFSGAGQQPGAIAGLSPNQREIASAMVKAIEAEEQNSRFRQIDNLGERAAWSDYSNRLVVQHRNLFFTLTVALDSPDAGLATAERLASLVIANIDGQI